jgi:hypothetical protein
MTIHSSVMPAPYTGSYTLTHEPRALDRTTPSLDVLDMASIIRELPGTCARTRLLRSITCARTMSLLLLLCI